MLFPSLQPSSRMSVFDVRDSVSTLKKQLKWHRFTVSLLTSVCLSVTSTDSGSGGRRVCCGCGRRIPAAGAGALQQMHDESLWSTLNSFLHSFTFSANCDSKNRTEAGLNYIELNKIRITIAVRCLAVRSLHIHDIFLAFQRASIFLHVRTISGCCVKYRRVSFC